LRSFLILEQGDSFGPAAMTAKDTKMPATSQDQKKARLAEELRANLLKRKAQARARRTGEADGRPEGIAAARKPDDAEAK